MTGPHKKLSRRDALKLLGAVAGATALANLPSEWSKPEVVRGVLPAHARTSSLGLQILSCNLSLTVGSGAWSSSPTVGPLPIPFSIPMKFTMTFVNMHFASGSVPQSPYIGSWNLDPATGTVLYVNNNNSYIPGDIVADPGAVSGSLTVLWEFLDPSHGSGSCSRTVNWGIT